MDNYCSSFKSNIPSFCKINEWKKTGCTSELPDNLQNESLINIRNYGKKISNSTKTSDWKKCFGNKTDYSVRRCIHLFIY